MLDKPDDEGYTPLHLAVISGNLRVARLLMDRGADVNSTDHERHSVIHWAVVCGELEILIDLQLRGANIR